ncbi:AMIN-like domain-containing (lipo)protein [Pedococcus sp. 5OH_020]|uniref:AMIN-like domain-containing (lipo)protein n=1 Tax=Pedococcus sp. 5OH_020 TaxID=2989814 RepID=UPI0022E9D6B8|nr:hypothetical protein [Pedococcus sp. 5OH_020]
MNITKIVRKPVAIRSLVLALAAGVLPLAVSSTSAQAAPYCGITWGSLTKSASTMNVGPLTNIRAGRHTCFDRLVVDLKGKPVGYRVGYVTNVYTEGKGDLVPLRGGAKLQVVVKAGVVSPTGTVTYQPANRREAVNVSGFTTFRQVAWAGSFEGQSTIGVGVRARLPFRAFTIQDATTSRLVIDVAHHW